MRAGRSVPIDFRAKQSVGIETTFRQRDGQSAFGAIVRALDETCADQFANGILHSEFARDVECGADRPSLRRGKLSENASRQRRVHRVRSPICADEDDDVAGVLEELRRDVPFVLDQADHRDVGVGSTTPAGLSLYRETFPPMTGVPKARQVSATPSTASRNCQKFSGL